MNAVKFDIHDYEKQLDRAETNLMKSELSDKNKKMIFDFKKYLFVQGISVPRVVRYLYTLKKIAGSIKKDLNDVQREDIENYLGWLTRRPYSEWTKQLYKVIIKRFFKWLYNRDGKDYPEIVSWISLRMPSNFKNLPSDESLLNEDDVLKLVSAAENLRDKAFVFTLWESGSRIGEVGSLRIKNIEFDEYGALLVIPQGKTGMRKIRLVNSTPYLANWLSIHSDKSNKDAPVWTPLTRENKGSLLKYRTISKMLKNLFKKAGIEKRSNPHSFRHARATYLANHLTEFQMNQYFGWVQGSDMPRTYVHLSGKNTDEAMLSLHGIKKKEKSEITPRLKKCPRCKIVNPEDNSFCKQCGGVLDIQTALELEDKKKSNEFKRKLADMLVEKLMAKGAVSNAFEKELKGLLCNSSCN